MNKKQFRMRWRDVTPPWWGGRGPDHGWTEARAAALMATLLATENVGSVLGDVDTLMVKILADTTDKELAAIVESS